MPALECQILHCDAARSILLEAAAAPPSGRACARDIVILSEPLTEPQWEMLRAFVRRTGGASLRLRFGQAADFADEATLRRLFGIAGHGDEMLWMLEESGAICGIVHLVRLSPTHAEIALIVRSDRARQGIGESLLHAALARAAEQGLSKLDALVLYENIPMLRLARKVGFEPSNSSGSLGLMVALDFDLGRMRCSEGFAGACAIAAAGAAVAGRV
jgi:RimJ/RimL family protein N-acetyltransferase